MAARILKAEQTKTESVLVVHLDDRRTTGDGEPDPAYVRRWTWPLKGPVETRRDYLGRIRQMARDLVERDLKALEDERDVESLTGQPL